MRLHPILMAVTLMLAAPVVTTMASCKNGAVPAEDSSAGQAGGCAGSGATAETQRIMEGLRPTCEGCHLTGTRGFFASLDAFQQLLVSDPRLVAPGDPDSSELVRLLNGQGSGSYKQMPTAGPSYAQLLANGAATISLDDIRSWISSLGAQQRGTNPAADAPRTTRIRAAQLQRTLYQQLGLGHPDFFTTAQSFDIPMANAIASDGVYAIQAAEMVPAPYTSALSPQDRFVALGGGSVFEQVRPNPSISPAFVQALTQVSQRWCRLALAKPNNAALFPEGGGLSTDSTQIKATLKRWHLHFLAEPGADNDVDTLYTKLFAPLQQTQGIEPAYVAACSYFIRHPHWIFY